MAPRHGIAYQHERLEGFLEEVGDALRRGDRRRCETGAFRLQGAVQAHFDVEEQVVFPSLRARTPASESELRELEAEHRMLRAQLETLCVSVVSSDAATVRALLEAFRDDLRAHEVVEEAIIAREATPPDPKPALRRPAR